MSPDTAYRQLEEASALLVMTGLCLERALNKLGRQRETDRARRLVVTEMHRVVWQLTDEVSTLARKMRNSNIEPTQMETEE